MAKLDHAKRVLKYEIFGLTLLVLGLVTLGDLGAVGQSFDDLGILLAGNWHFLLPIYLMWVAVNIMIRKSRFRYTAFQSGILMLGLVILVWSELDLYSQAVQLYGPHPDLLRLTNVGIHSLQDSLKVLVITSTGQLPPASAGGGMMGYVLFSGLQYLFAVTGTVLVLIVATLVSLILVTRKSLVATIEKGSQYFEKRLSRGWAGTMRGLAKVLGSSKGSGPRSSGKGQDAPDKDGTDRTLVVPFNRDEKRRKKRWPRTQETDTLDVVGDGEDLQAQSGKTSFPFPDFGVPYVEAPPYEDFLSNHASDAETDSVGLKEDSNGGEANFKIDEDQARVTVRFDRGKPSVLAPDPPGMGDDLRGTATGEGTERPYRLPDTRILDRPSGKKGDSAAATRDLQAHAKKLGDTFESFGVSVKVLGYSRGPTVTRFEIQPAVGVKVSRILSLSDDLALALAARDIRIEAPIPGKSAIGIEVPNKEISVVTFREVVETETFTQAKSLLSFALGKDIAGNTIVGDLAKMPHVLVAGATGSGKSVCINGIVASILFRAKPEEVKIIMIDPKMVELGVYNGIPHLLAPVVTDARRAAAALRKVIAEMEHRYELFHNAKVRDLERYNAYAATHGKRTLPLIVVIIDELADLMMVAPGDVEDAICRLAQMARASGIHLVVATQRPSVDVITGLIKANIPSRIAFAVSSGVDSRTILDGTGAEKLLGRGDMLYMPVGASKPIRLQGSFLSEPEVEKLVEFVRHQQDAEYVDEFTNLTDEKAAVVEDLDPLFEDAVKLVVESEQASVSYLQRRLKIGYSRAARLVDTMEQLNIVGPFENSKPREVLMTREAWLERQSSMG